MIKRFASYLCGSRGRVAGAAVLAYALTLAVFVGRTYVEPLPGKYSPDFGPASWIQLPQPETAAYFRKTLYLLGPVEQASITLGSTGNYTLYVNNVTVDRESYEGVRVTGAYDLKTLLAPGKNVIAVHVGGGTFPTTPQIRVRGVYRVTGGVTEEFVSDASWKASETPDGVIGNHSWAATGLEDGRWDNAVTAPSSERFSTVQPLTSDPALFEQPPFGRWIEAPMLQAHRASFADDVEMPRGARQVWLQIAASGGYDLFVNSRLAAIVAGDDRAVVFGPDETVPLGAQITRAAHEMPRLFEPLSGAAGGDDLAALVPIQPRPQAPGQEPPSPPAPGVLERNPVPTNPAVSAAGRPTRIMVGAANTIVSGFSFASPTPLPTPAPTNRGPTLISPPLSHGPAVYGTRASPTPAVTTLTQPVPIGGDASAANEAVAPPNLGEIAAPDAPRAPQPFPLAASIGEEPASPAMIGYDLTDFFHPGSNRILVRVESVDGPAALLVDGSINLDGGERDRFGSGNNWLSIAGENAGGPPIARHVVALASFGRAGVIPQVAAIPHLLPGDDVRLLIRWSATVVMTVVLVMLLWAVAAPWCASASERIEDMWGYDALLHIPMMLALLGMWLSCFDVRLPYDWCFQPTVVVSFLLLIPLTKVLLLTKRGALRFGSSSSLLAVLAGWNWQPLALAGIVIAALIVRARGLTDTSMSHDEVSVLRMTEGIFKVGFPFIKTGSFVRYAATYELLPYPIALGWLLLGPTTLALRLPALIFGSLTVGLIGWVGRRMMDWRVGLTAALIYAFLPAAILHSRDLFYPAQECFFALLTVWLFYEAVRDPGINRRAMSWATAAFVCTYLSWEGSGFFLPAFFIAMVACKWGEWDWLRDRHLWRCVAVAATAVVVELLWKLNAVVPDYLGVGKDLNELASPKLVFLDRLVFDPFFYLKNFLFIDNQSLLTIVAMFGLILLRRDKTIRYLNILLVSLAILYTCFLGLYHPKYAYNWTPILVLVAVGTTFHLYDRISEICVSDRSAVVVRGLAEAMGAALLIGFANPYLVKLYRLSAVPEIPAFDSRLGVSFNPDYRTEDLYVARHQQPGDAVITPAPHVFIYDTGVAPDYSMDTMLSYRYYFDRGRAEPGFIDRSIGVPLILNLDDLKRAQTKYRRLWIIERNIRVDAETPDITSYLLTHGRVVYESDMQSVVLLDGVGPAEIAGSRAARSDVAMTRH